MTITIYHNPRCSKSRESLQILEASGFTPEIVEYLLEPPNARTILRLAALLGVPVADLLRRGEAEFKDAADLPQLDNDAELAAWIEKNPKVLQRPIVVDEDQGIAVIGRPPENVLQLVGQ
ncbi:MAG: arsenate reductase (glutaredoxin) [Proteobacteria bacterium]|nr:arsenate reductase (glutaredoxin) [Pseudomonadota bacterium]